MKKCSVFPAESILETSEQATSSSKDADQFSNKTRHLTKCAQKNSIQTQKCNNNFNFAVQNAKTYVFPLKQTVQFA